MLLDSVCPLQNTRQITISINTGYIMSVICHWVMCLCHVCPMLCACVMFARCHVLVSYLPRVICLCHVCPVSCACVMSAPCHVLVSCLPRVMCAVMLQ